MNHGRQLVVFGLASVLLVAPVARRRSRSCLRRPKRRPSRLRRPCPTRSRRRLLRLRLRNRNHNRLLRKKRSAKPPKRHGGKKKVTTPAAGEPAGGDSSSPRTLSNTANKTVAMAHPPANPAATPLPIRPSRPTSATLSWHAETVDCAITGRDGKEHQRIERSFARTGRDG